jgi:integrase/recombinase XerD
MLDAGVDLRDVKIAARHANPHHHAVGQGPPEPGPPPNYILAAYMASGT